MPAIAECPHLRSALRSGIWAAATLAALAALATPARAAFTVDFAQIGPNVVATGRGSIDTADLVVNSFGGIAPFVLPSFPTVVLGPDTFAPITIFTVAAATGLPPIGTGSNTFGSSGTGDIVGFQSHLIVLPQSYVSGAPLSDSETWNNATFASLGLTPGSYSETFGTGAGADTIAINVAAIPEPGSLASLVVAVIALGVMRLKTTAPEPHPPAPARRGG